MTDQVESISTLPERSAQTVSSFARLQQVLAEYIPELDGIRALAVITVVWHNVTAGRYTGGALLKIINMFSNTGWVGVQWFFVLSGFLITGILLDEKKSPDQLRNFYMRRFLRIFPLYYAVLFVAFVVWPLFRELPAWLIGDYHHQIWFWTFLTNWSAPFLNEGGSFGHFWSLAVEEQFYLLWPLCVVRLQRPTLIIICKFLILSALFLRAVLIFHDLTFAEGAAYKFTFARWDALAVGALLALLLRDRNGYLEVVKKAPLILVGSSIYIGIFIVFDRNFAPVDPGLGPLNQTAVALLFGALVFYAIRIDVHRTTPWQRFLSSNWLRLIGKYSYAIYVFHLPLEQIISPFWQRHFSQLPTFESITILALLVFGASYASAVCSWFVLERPCLRLKRFFITNKAASAA